MKKAAVLPFLAILLFSCTKSKLPSGNISTKNLSGFYGINWGDDILIVNDILIDN